MLLKHFFGIVIFLVYFNLVLYYPYGLNNYLGNEAKVTFPWKFYMVDHVMDHSTIRVNDPAWNAFGMEGVGFFIIEDIEIL